MTIIFNAAQEIVGKTDKTFEAIASRNAAGDLISEVDLRELLVSDRDWYDAKAESAQRGGPSAAMRELCCDYALI